MTGWGESETAGVAALRRVAGAAEAASGVQ